MARKRKGDPVHGWLVIDKPLNMSSAKAVYYAKNYLNAAKVGHGGTLDPMASGVLPLAFGEATKTLSYAVNKTKKYKFTIRWGEARDTDDLEGNIIGTSDKRPGVSAIQNILKRFIGEVNQVPPAYSAVKISGQRAYKLARAGNDVILKPRPVFIEDLTLMNILSTEEACFQLCCGKGVYVRSLARDLARALGTVGCVSNLRRTQVGNFLEKDAISLDQLKILGHKEAVASKLLPVETVLDDIPALVLTEEEAKIVKNGIAIPLIQLAKSKQALKIGVATPFYTICQGKIISLAKIESGRVTPYRVLNL
ncbi:MAG: tRNA pseudouridine(55) synthase TruB [Rhodospirillales bacterium]|nr:tRNA pseudouridine(55) synthase TruB [Rhodospirillales bacterium]